MDIHTTIDKKITRPENAEACMRELRLYILNNEQRVTGLGDELRILIGQEEYERAEVIKVMQSEISSSNYRLKRILQGLPAFEKSIDKTTNHS